MLTGSPGALYAPEDCGWPGGRCGLQDLRNTAAITMIAAITYTT